MSISLNVSDKENLNFFLLNIISNNKQLEKIFKKKSFQVLFGSNNLEVEIFSSTKDINLLLKKWHKDDDFLIEVINEYYEQIQEREIFNALNNYEYQEN